MDTGFPSNAERETELRRICPPPSRILPSMHKEDILLVNMSQEVKFRVQRNQSATRRGCLPHPFMSMIVRRFASTSTSRLSLAPNIRQLLANSTPSDTEKTTTVSGWIKSIRKQKNMSFAVVTDGSSPKGLQAVLVKGKEDEILRRYLSALCIPLCSHMNGQVNKWCCSPSYWSTGILSG